MVKRARKSLTLMIATIVIVVWMSIAVLGTIFLPTPSNELRAMFAFSQIIPILISSFYFGRSGGLLVALIASLVSGSLVIFNIEDINTISIQRIMFQILSFNSVALLTSFLSDQEKLHRKQISRQLERMTTLRAIDKAINSGADLNDTMNILLESLPRLLDIEAAAILLCNPKTSQLELKANFGFLGEYPLQSLNRQNESLAMQAMQEGCTIFHANISDREPAMAKIVPGSGIIAYYAVPLISYDDFKGVLEVYDRAPDPDEEWQEYLEMLAEQAAIAIAQSRFVENLQEVNTEMLQAYDETLRGWSRALDLRDSETEGHTQRVVSISVKLAERMGLQGEQLLNFQRGAVLHDIGKIGIPDRVLLKPGPLTEEEWTVMRKHPVFSQVLLSPIKYLHKAMLIPNHHHERWDGSGYPNGLLGEDIPLEARIFAVVDVWDAMRFDRPYREALSDEACLKYIRERSGKAFDPQVVDAFIKMFEEDESLW